MKTKNTLSKGRTQTVIAANPAITLFQEIRRALHGIGGDVQDWKLPPLDPKKAENSIQPSPGPFE